MAIRAALLTGLIPTAFWAASAGSAVQQSASTVRMSTPVEKVVSLLEDMKAQVEKEAQQDMLAYNKYMCWCTTNREEKTLAIKNAEQQIADLTAFLEEAAAKEAQLKTQIAGLAQDIVDDQEAISSATALRADENAKFLEEEADMKETRSLLEQAIDVLSKVQLLQKSHGAASVAGEVRKATTALVQVREIVKTRFPNFKSTMQRDFFDVLGSLQEASPKALSSAILDDVLVSERKAAAFSQNRLLPWEKTDEQIGQEKKANELVGAASGAKSYNARSGRILGIISEMQDEFTRDLGSAQYDEYMALVSYQKLHAAKTSEIYIATQEKARKEKELADLLYAVAKAKEDKAALEEAKAADEAFLAELEKNCKSEDEEYHQRLAVRTEEIRALSEALKILSEDEARATFDRSISFLQRKSGKKTSSDSQRAVAQMAARDRAAERAMQRIAKVAHKHKNWALVSLAVHVQLDSFTKVLEMMDKMLADLNAQQKAEYEKWENCKREIDTTEDTIKVKENVKKDLDEKHLSLTDKLSTLTTDIETLKKEVAANEISLKDAGEDRKEENLLYQQSVMDQRATVNILNKALARLKAFYMTKGGSFVQAREEPLPVPGAAAPPPPPKGKAYEKSAGASGAIQVIIKIIEDAESSEKELDVTENNAQRRYAAIVSDLKASIEADRNAIEEKEGQVASTEVEKSETEEAQLANGEELADLTSLLKSHHLECDFLIKYFDVRQQARSEEMDAITDAKAILSGADFGK